MTDKEILEEAHRRLCFIEGNFKGMDNTLEIQSVRSFIEQEWQRQDEEEAVNQYNRNRSPKDWIVDVREMERHRGLEIGEDGTVESLK
jgi:hypothetical protein